MDVNSSRHTSRTIYHIVSCSYDCIGLDDTVSLLYDCIRMNLPVHSSLLSRIGNNNGSLYHRTVSDNSGILLWELGTSLYMITDIFFTHKRGKSIDPHQLWTSRTLRVTTQAWLGTRNCTRVEQHDKPQIVEVDLPIEIIIRDLEGSSCMQSPQCITSYLIYENITSYMYSSQNVHHETSYTITCEPPYVMHPCNVPMHSSCSAVSFANSSSPSVHVYMFVYTYTRYMHMCILTIYVYTCERRHM